MAGSLFLVLKPSTYPVWGRMALGMTVERMEQIKKLYLRGYHGESEKVVLAETIQADVDRLKKTVEGLEKKFERLSGTIQPAWNDYNRGIGAVAEEKPPNADDEPKKIEPGDVV